MKRDRNYTVDLFKYIFSLMVIAIHVHLFSEFNHFLYALTVQVFARAAVPFFAVCTGFFLYGGVIEKEHTGGSVKTYFFKYFKRVFLLYAIWSCIYLLYSIPKWIKIDWFSIWSFVDYGINAIKQGSYYHLWYLVSLLYALPLFFLLITKTRRSIWIILSIVLYAVELLTYSYSFLLPSELAFLIDLRSNWDALFSAVFRILPFLLLGAFCQEIKKSISGYSIVVLILAFLFQLLEVLLLNKAGHSTVSYIVMTYPVVLVLFMLVIRMRTPIRSAACRLLGRISGFVYCVHPMIIEVLQHFELSSVLNFLITSVSATLLAIIFERIKIMSKKYCKLSENESLTL